MEPARLQLARPLPALKRTGGGTIHPSVHADRVALGYMHHWSSFEDDVMHMFRSVSVTHEVPIHDESEHYVVGNELGLTGRFVRNLCGPVMAALRALPQMSSMHFADIQAFHIHGGVIPDLTFGLVARPEPFDPLDPFDPISMVGELETPWTVGLSQMDITSRTPDPCLESLIGIFFSLTATRRVLSFNLS